MIMKRMLFLTLMSVAVSNAAMADQLQQVVSETVLSNPEVKQVVNARNAIFEEVNQAKSGFYPKVDVAAGVGYEWTKNRSTASVGDGDVELLRRETTLSLRQMLFDGFLTDNELNRQSARLESGNHRLREIAEEKALEATRVYVEVIKRQELLNQANETLYNHVKVYEQIRRRSESGLGTLASIQQAEGRLALAEVNVLSAENNLLDAKTTYQRITGVMPPETLESPALELKTLPDSSDKAVQRALANHPTLKLAESDVMAANAQYESAKSLMYPKLNFEVDRTWNNNIDGVEGDNEDLTAMFRVRYNLYNGGGDKARIRQTHHQINEAKDIRVAAQRQAVEGVELSWNAYQILGRQLKFLEQHTISSQETRDSYLKQFNIGQRSLLDLLDTENEVFSSKNAYITAKYDYLVAQYRLLNGMGEMLDTLQVSVDALASTEFNDEAPSKEKEVPKS